MNFFFFTRAASIGGFIFFFNWILIISATVSLLKIVSTSRAKDVHFFPRPGLLLATRAFCQMPSGILRERQSSYSVKTKFSTFVLVAVSLSLSRARESCLTRFLSPLILSKFIPAQLERKAYYVGEKNLTIYLDSPWRKRVLHERESSKPLY